MSENDNRQMLESTDGKHRKKDSEPGIHTGDGRSNTRKKFTFSIWYFIIAIILIIIFNNLMMS